MNYHKLHESWNKFLKEEDLNEATDEEIDHISDILHDLKYDDLPFGNMFGETTRLIQPMKTKDKELEKRHTIPLRSRQQKKVKDPPR